MWRLQGVLLSVAVGNNSEEFDLSGFDYKWHLRMKKSIFGPRWVRTEMGLVVWGSVRDKVGVGSWTTRLCQWSPT